MDEGGTIRARVEQDLGGRIAAGVIAPGSLLSVPTLAAEYAVSATPVREAVLELERRGFVTASRNRGFVVTAVDPAHADHVAEVRDLLEPVAMRGVAERRPAPDLTEARALADAVAEHAADGDLAAYLETDRRFHLLLTALTGNPMLTAVVDDLRRRTRLPGLPELVGTSELQRSAAEHHELAAAIERGDGDAAEAITRRHIGHTRGWWAGRPE